eukprot:1141855-Pelagomonas_calceolata.AAC.2
MYLLSFSGPHAHWVKGLFRDLREAGCANKGISRAKLVIFVHVYLKFVTQVGEILDLESVGAVHAFILCVRGLQRKPVGIVERFLGIWECNICGVCEGCGASAGEARLPLLEGTCVNSYGRQGEVIGISFSKRLMLGVVGYAVVWQDLKDSGVASGFLVLLD